VTKAHPKQRRRPAAPRAARRSSAHRTWLVLGAVVLAAAIVAVVVTAGGESSAAEPAPSGSVSIDHEPGPALQPGEAIPEWSAPALDGSGTMHWSDYLGGPIVLTVWAPWCPHCQAELPRLVERLRFHPDITLVTISTAVEQSTAFTSQGYLDAEGLSFPVAVDDAALTLHDGLGVEGFPSTYFVTADGTVVRHEEGEIGLQEDGSVDPSVLDDMLTELEDASPQD
jgi:thiol-disulfide isomerase/thioredoxin